MKRGILGAALVLAIVAVAYGYNATRRERVYRQLVIQGDHALSRGDTFAAVSAFADAITLKPESMLGYLKRGDAYRRRGELEAAAADLQIARTLDPSALRALELLGDVDAARQRHTDAAAHYAAYVRVDDRSPRVLYKLGLSRHLSGAHADAAEALRHAVKLDGRFAEAHYLLGVCLRAMKQPAGALAAFERAVAVSPNLLPAREQLADLLGRLGRRAERIRQLEQLLSADASAARQVALALAYADAGQLPRAVRMLRSAAELYPDEPAPYLALGRIWLETGAPARDRVALSKAIEALQHAVSLDASSAALTLLGQARLAVSDPGSAERTLRLATETFPAEPAAFLHLADAADSTGHPQVVRRALVDYQILTGAADPALLVRIAHAEWRAGDSPAALATLARVFQKDPHNKAARDLQQRIR